MTKSTDESCLVLKLGHYIKLTKAEKELLIDLEKSTRSYARNSEIFRSGEKTENLYSVKSGWLVSYTILPDGRRQILQIHFPGDIVGIADIPFRKATHDLKTLTECQLCPFPKHDLDRIFIESPRLTSLLFSMVMVDQAVNLDRLRVLGRMNAKERVVHFLLTTLSRLRMTNHDLGDTFDFPLTQFDLADAVGLTNVSVSNALSALQEQGALKRAGGRISVLDENAMRESSSFVNRYEPIDISWFPHTRAN